MALVNTSKPVTILANTTRTNIAETWDSITTSWASETRTWDGTASTISNTTRQSSLLTNVSKPA